MAGHNRQPHEHKVFNFELKDVSLEDSVFTGFSAAMGNRDLGNDIIDPGSFKKTIRERVDRRYIKLLDNHNSHSTRDVWGTVVEAEEVKVDASGDNAPTHKLLTTFEVSRADENAQTALRKIAERHLDQLSIGFRSLREEFEADEDSKEEDPRFAWMMGQGTRRIKEVQWWETSVVIWAMNPEAQILANSVNSLLDFAHKAATSGVKVPADTVRETIRALSMLTGDAMPASGPTDEVHEAVSGVKESLARIDGMVAGDEEEGDELNTRLRSLMQSYEEAHGEADVTKFTMWVDETLLDAAVTDAVEEKTDEEPIEETEVTDDDTQEQEAKEDETATIDEDASDVEAKDDPEPDTSPESDEGDDVEEMSLLEEMRALSGRIDKLANTLVAGTADEDERVDETPVDDPADHNEDEKEAAKGTETETEDDKSADDDDGRTEHFPDGDELALELAALEIDMLRTTA